MSADLKPLPVPVVVEPVPETRSAETFTSAEEMSAYRMSVFLSRMRPTCTCAPVEVRQEAAGLCCARCAALFVIRRNELKRTAWK